MRQGSKKRNKHARGGISMARTKQAALKVLEQICGAAIANQVRIGFISGRSREAVTVTYQGRVFAHLMWSEDSPLFRFAGTKAEHYKKKQVAMQMATVEARLASGEAVLTRDPEPRDRLGPDWIGKSDHA